MFSNDKMLAELSSQSDGGARQESDKSSVDSQGSLTNWLCHFNTQLGSYKNKLTSDSCHLILVEQFLCQHRDIFSWTSAMWADQLALSLGQLLLSERLSWQKCFASTSQSGGDIDEAQIGQKQLMAQSSDAFSCLVRFCTLDVFLDAFQTNLVTVELLSHVLKSSIKEEVESLSSSISLRRRLIRRMMDRSVLLPIKDAAEISSYQAINQMLARKMQAKRSNYFFGGSLYKKNHLA